MIFKQEKPINIGYYFAKEIIHTRVQICRFVVDATVKTESLKVYNELCWKVGFSYDFHTGNSIEK